MSLNVGDLVQCRSHGTKVGLVVDKRISNDGLYKSLHVRHMLNTYQLVYYVYFSGEGRTGPFYSADLKLHQTIKPLEPSKDEV